METPVMEWLFNKVSNLKACNFIKKRLQRRCFHVIIARFLRVPILKNICERLLLQMIIWKNLISRKELHFSNA